MEAVLEVAIDNMSTDSVQQVIEPYVVGVNPIADEQRDIIISCQMQCAVAKINKDIFERIIPSREVIETYIKTSHEIIKTFKDRFSSYPSCDDFVDVIMSKYNKKLRKFEDVLQHRIEQMHDECSKYLKDIDTRLETDEKLQEIYRNADEVGMKNYIQTIIQTACANLNISFEKINEQFPDLQTTLDKLPLNMKKQQDMIADCQKQLQTNLSKFTESLTKCITTMRVTTFSDDQSSEWDKNIVKVNEIYTKALNRKPKKCDKSISLDDFMKKYTDDVKRVYNELWTTKCAEIQIQKNRDLLNRMKTLDDMPTELRSAKKVKKLSEKELVQCNGTSAIMGTDCEFLIKVASHCEQDIYYIGRVYENEEDEIYEVPVNKLIKNTGISQGIYSKENIPQLTLSALQEDKLFDIIDIDNSEHKIYVFCPDHQEIFSKYVSILNNLNELKEIESAYGITIASLITLDI